MALWGENIILIMRCMHYEHYVVWLNPLQWVVQLENKSSISIAQNTQMDWNGRVDQIMALYKSDYFRCVSPISEIWLDLI